MKLNIIKLKRTVSMLMAVLAVLFVISGEFKKEVYAANTTILSISQGINGDTGSMGAVSQEQFINDIMPLKYLSISVANTEVHFYCHNCGAVGYNASAATVNVFGYRKDNGEQETVASYVVSGLDGSARKSSLNQLMLTDEIKKKYSYLKVAASFSGVVSGKCVHPMDDRGEGYYGVPGSINVVAASYDEPVFNPDGNLENAIITEGVADYIGVVNAYFPSSVGNYTWQYQEDGNWISLIDGTESYKTNTHGNLELCDKNGGTNFAASNMLKLKNPEMKMSGLKFRVILNSGVSGSNTTSNEATLTVNSRNVVGFYSARLASRYGEVGEKLSLDEIISYVKFDNGQIVETEKLMKADSQRVSFYGFIEPSDKSKSAEKILEGIRDGSISYTELGADSAYLNVNEGENTFYIKFSYAGKDDKEVFAFVTFTGKDERPPVFDENVELYEKDGMSLYTRGDYAISDENVSDYLRIRGCVSDSISDSSKIQWAYTLTETKNEKDEISIPVYRAGNEIDVKVSKNGKYILYAEDDSGNTAQKTFVIKAFDENLPELSCSVRGISDDPESGIFGSFRIDAVASDVEKLHTKPYMYKYFAKESDAKSYNMINASTEDYVSANSYTVNTAGYYVVAARDAVGKTVKEVVAVPDKAGNIIDSTNPQITISPVPIKDASSSMSEYNISFVDNVRLKQFKIVSSNSEVVKEINHNHSLCKDEGCGEVYHFIPTEAGNYKVLATDCAGNKSEASFVVSERKIEGAEITDLSDSMSVNAEISLKNLKEGSRILLKMSDGTTEVFSNQNGVKAELFDEEDQSVEKITIGYGENKVKLVITINSGNENERKLEYEKIIIGEDNVAPLPGTMSEEMSEGWDGSLTNDLSKKMTLHVSGYADDGSDADKLIITWYRNDEEVQKKTVSEGGDVYGPFSGEDANGVYRYTVTDENGNSGFSTFEKNIDCWDVTPPTGDVKIMPEGTTEDSMARYKQIQIVNVSDNKGLAEKPYSFRGNSSENYSIINSVVAGENATFEIYLKDSAGNVTHLKDLNLSGIDSKAPTINGYEILDGDEGKKVLHIDAIDINQEGEEDNKGLKYSIDGENYQESPDFEIGESGSYTIYVKDETGNVTRTSTDYTDTDIPSVSVVQDESGAGVLIISASDNVGLSRIMMDGPDGLKEIVQVYDGACDDVIRKEIGKTGDYKITVTDMSGNTAEATITITSIAPACSSSILTGLKLTPAGWTNGDVTVIAQLTDTKGLSSSPFKWNNSLPTAQPYVIMTENGDATVELCDIYGNIIATQTVPVGNIDRIAPVLSKLEQSEDKNHLIIKVSDNGSGLSQITISGGPYSIETGAITLDGEKESEEIQLTLPTNGTYTVRAYDMAGNSSQKQITVEGVTTDIAKIEYKEIEKIVEKPVEKIITEEKIVTQTETITQTVDKPVPILVPVPTTETIIKYKTIKEKGEDTSIITRGDDIYTRGDDTETIIDGSNTETVEKETVENEISNENNNILAKAGEYTSDGTYIAPDGYEYFGRIDPNFKKNHPFKYWFKKNAEKIAIAACILALIFLTLCIIMGIMLTKDYFSEQKDKRDMNRIGKRSGKM